MEGEKGGRKIINMLSEKHQQIILKSKIIIIIIIIIIIKTEKRILKT